MEIEEIVKGIKSSVDTIKSDVNAKFEDYKALAKTIDEIKNTDVTKSAEFIKAQEELVADMQSKFDAFQTQINESVLSLKHANEDSNKSKITFKDAFATALNESKEALTSFVNSNNKSADFKLDIKAVGDMSQQNFGTGSYALATTEVRQGVSVKPFSPLWLRNILPSASTSKASISYIQGNGGEGAAAIWNPGDGTATRPDKPQIDFDFVEKNVKVEWIAGIVRIPREMLDDIEWIQSYVINQIIYGPRGILKAENDLILSTLSTNSVAYNGTKTKNIEKLFDAAFGQLAGNYFTPNVILMNNRDMLDVIAFNKASGSGEYDLPNLGLLVPQVVNGVMTVGGVQIVGAPNVPQGTAYVMDTNQTQFVSRMAPEVMYFEQDRDNVIKNLVTIRGEERAACLVFFTDAVIKVTITADSSSI